MHMNWECFRYWFVLFVANSKKWLKSRTFMKLDEIISQWFEWIAATSYTSKWVYYYVLFENTLISSTKIFRYWTPSRIIQVWNLGNNWITRKFYQNFTLSIYCLDQCKNIKMLKRNRNIHGISIHMVMICRIVYIWWWWCRIVCIWRWRCTTYEFREYS